METSDIPLHQEFDVIAERIHAHALQRPDHLALDDGVTTLRYGDLDRLMDRIAAALQRDGLAPGDAIAICATTSTTYAAVFLGALRAGAAVAPLAPSSAPASLGRMLRDAKARLVFTDASTAEAIGAASVDILQLALDSRDFDDWLAPVDARPVPVHPQPSWPFNIIYSSGTTGEPKGIVQGHGMRWAHVRRTATYRYGPDAVSLLSTPLYSNTTLVAFFPNLANGGTVHLMPKFDAAAWLALAERLRVTHTMLVPVQYQRLLARPDFDAHDLSSFRFKFCTSAPFGAALKAQVLARWPGGLVDTYGMTEGGGTCMLEAHLHPDKLHTVGRPIDGSDIRLIDDAGIEAAPGEAGEVVGHSPGMMTGYHGQPDKTREAEWFAPDGKRFIRTGDIGRFDADGFLILFDRKKDMIISGGFNIFPSDLEAVLKQHPGVADAAVVGVPSDQWGESPVAFVVRQGGDATSAADLLQWANAQLGKTQRLADLNFIDTLPRSPIGKVLKRELRDLHAGRAH